MSRALHLSHIEFDVLHDLVLDAVNDMDEEILPETVTYQIYQKLIHLTRGNK